MGSIKSNIGHSEPAAGLSGLMKVILAMEKGRIPGNPTFIDPNPNIDFEGSRLRVTRFTIPWPAPQGQGQGGRGLRRASVNSFGYGGSNVHVIVDSVPEKMQTFISSFGDGLGDLFADEGAVVSRVRPHVLLFSANEEPSLRAYTESLRTHLLNPRVTVDMSSLAYTLSERRSRHFHRGYTVSNDFSLDPASIVYAKKKPEAPQVAFIFTGQGAQWSQMGRSLIENFKVARTAIERLDTVLQGMVHPPSWSLMGELTEPRSPERLRHPEFSQPLVTALQIAIVCVLDSWGVRAEAVVGHSSGEMAAAYAAGLLSEENAIKAAYYRGYAATATREGGEAGQSGKLGMLAVGLGELEVQPYISKAHSANNSCVSSKTVSIACFNSSSSVTLSGTVDALEAVRGELVADHHFARMLQVNMAYHSAFMATAGDEYVRCLEAEAFSTTNTSRYHADDASSRTKLFSSVQGHLINRPVDTAYWKSNMVQPVLFEQALSQMLSQQEDPPDFLIEIGPSGALAGPVSQVKKTLPGGGAHVQYRTAMTRGKDAENAIFDVAGSLFIAGHAGIDFTMVNNNVPTTNRETPKLVTDLPGYSWTHGTDYWYENEASQDWRNRKFPHHDLLGSKVLGTAWQAPAWKKTLKIEDLPWLGDHRLGAEIVFPAAGYMCMAIEAMLQTDTVLRSQKEGSTTLALSHDQQQQVRLRNVSFDRALVLEEGKDARIMLTLAPFAGNQDSWYYWVVRSLVPESSTWVDHCKGQVRVEKDVKITASPSAMSPLLHPSPGALWYKSMSDVGYNFGESFRKLQLAETTSGSRKCRSQVDLLAPASEYRQSEYPMHPAAFDGCLQSCAPGLWRGTKSSVNAVLVPAIIDDVVVRMTDGAQKDLASGISVSESLFAGPGRADLAKNYSSNAKVYNPQTGELVVKLTGLRYHMLDFSETPYAAHLYSKLVWAPDVAISPQACATSSTRGWEKVHEMADLLAHKMPNAKVVEASLIPGDAYSIWLQGVSSTQSNARNAFSSYSLLSSDAAAVVAAQDKYGAVPRTGFQLFNVGVPSASEPDQSLRDADVLILRLPSGSRDKMPNIMGHVSKMLRTDGHLLVLEQSGVWEVDPGKEPGLVNGSVGPATNGHTADMEEALKESGFGLKYAVNCRGSLSLSNGYLARRLVQQSVASVALSVDVVHISKPGPICDATVKALKEGGGDWDLREIHITHQSLGQIRKDAMVLVVSELDSPQLPTLDPTQWQCVQQLLQMRNRILWVSHSSQWEVKNPDGAMIHGLCRSVRTEDPSMRITTLDLEDPTSGISVSSIDLLLKAIQKPSPITGVEGEYVERGGILHVSRIIGDDVINETEHARTAGAQPVQMRLHEADMTIRMIAERVGSLDSLHYAQVDSKELPLADNTVEVELFASALNFKDVAVTMGIVPENQHLLGREWISRDKSY